MVVIVWDEPLEQKLRREYNVPYSIPADNIHSFIGKRMAERAMEKFSLDLKEEV